MSQTVFYFDASALDAHIDDYGRLVLSLPRIECALFSESAHEKLAAAGLDQYAIDAAQAAALDILHRHVIAAKLLKARC